MPTHQEIIEGLVARVESAERKCATEYVRGWNDGEADAEALRLRAERSEREREVFHEVLLDVRDVLDAEGGPEWTGLVEKIQGALEQVVLAPPALTLTAEEAWSREEEAVGRAAHEAWIVQGGYADHGPWPPKDSDVDGSVFMRPKCRICGLSFQWHHPDMIPWEDLPVEKRGKYLELGKAGYLLGFAARAKLAADGER